MNEPGPGRGRERPPERGPSLWSRWIFPDRERDSRWLRLLKGFARTGVVVVPLLVLIDLGHVQGWW